MKDMKHLRRLGRSPSVDRITRKSLKNSQTLDNAAPSAKCPLKNGRSPGIFELKKLISELGVLTLKIF